MIDLKEKHRRRKLMQEYEAEGRKLAKSERLSRFVCTIVGTAICLGIIFYVGAAMGSVVGGVLGG